MLRNCSGARRLTGSFVGLLLLVAAGFASMWMGVFADVGVAVLAILNAMRALKVPKAS